MFTCKLLWQQECKDKLQDRGAAQLTVAHCLVLTYGKSKPFVKSCIFLNKR
jgi:hypothetical protein